MGDIELTEGKGGGVGWSPSQEEIAFTGLDCKLNIVNLTDLETRKITSGSGCDKNPNWSPDGNYIVYDTSHPEYPHLVGKDIMLVEINSGISMPDQVDKDPIFNNDPFWCK